MQKILLLALALCLTVFMFIFGAIKPKEDEEKGPQWFSQWYEMKKDAHGQIPQLMNHKWAKQDAAFALFKTNAGPLLDSVRSLGPDNVGGRTRAIVVDWADTTHYFSGSVAGGLWESKDEGANWKPVNDNQENLNITAITQNPFNKNIYYYSTGEPYPINDASSNTGGQLGGGVFKSVDGGITFTVLPSTLNTNFTSTWDIKHALNDSNTLYVATDDKGLFKSIDGGVTFTNVFVTTAKITRIEVLKDGSILIACRANGVYKSPTGNTGTFTKLGNGFATGVFGLLDFSICKNFPNVMFAVVSSSNDAGFFGTYKTSDGGATWRISPGANVGYSYTWFCLTTAICPTDTNKIFVGSVACGYSVNGGQNWTISNPINSHADYHKLYTIDGTNKLLCGNDGGIYRYNWNTLGAFTDLNPGYNVTQYYAGSFFKKGLSVIMGAQDNGTHRIIDGNKISYNLYGGDGCFNAINQQDDTKGYLSYQNTNIYKASSLITSPPTGGLMNFSNGDTKWFITPFETNTLDGNQIYVPTKSRVYRSTGGAFTAITNASAKQPYAIGLSIDSNPVVYFGGSSMLLSRVDSALTTTAGKEKDLTANKPAALSIDFVGCIKVHPNNKNTIFITLTNYKAAPRVWRITNTDLIPVWTDISGNLPASLPCNSIEVDPSNPDTRFFVATDFGLYGTEDGGTTWVKETRIPNVCIYNIRLRPGDRKLFIFTHGRGVWAANVLPYPLIKPTAEFDLSHTQACERELVTFTDISANAPIQVSWSFENGTPSTAFTTIATTMFSGAGVKKIKLVVINAYGIDSIEKTITIFANPKPTLIKTGNQLQSTITGNGYTWYRDNIIIPENTQTIAANTGGWYKLKINNGSGCFAMSDSVQVINAGINQLAFGQNFSFYPNPATTSITINSTADATVKIFSLEGEVVLSFPVLRSKVSKHEIAYLSKGVYLMVFESGKENYTYKLIKQ